MVEIQKKEVYNDIYKYNVPVFEISEETFNGKTYSNFTLDSCLFTNNFNNITLNNNCIQFIRKVKLAKTNNQALQIDSNYVVSNPYFSNNQPENEYHLISIYLNPGYYNTINDVVNEINKRMFSLRDHLFFNKANMRTITKNSGYIGKLTSAINVKNTLINDGVVSMPSSISATTITKQQALNYKDYNDKLIQALSIYKYNNIGSNNTNINNILYSLPVNYVIYDQANNNNTYKIFRNIEIYNQTFNNIDIIENYIININFNNISNLDNVYVQTTTNTSTTITESIFIIQININNGNISIIVSPNTSVSNYSYFGSLVGEIICNAIPIDTYGMKVETEIIAENNIDITNTTFIINDTDLKTFINSSTKGLDNYNSNYSDTYSFATLYSYPSTSITTNEELASLVAKCNLPLSNEKFMKNLLSDETIYNTSIKIASEYWPKLIGSYNLTPILANLNEFTYHGLNQKFQSKEAETRIYYSQGIVYSCVFDVAKLILDYFGSILNDMNLYNEFVNNSYTDGIDLSWFENDIYGNSTSQLTSDVSTYLGYDWLSYVSLLNSNFTTACNLTANNVKNCVLELVCMFAEELFGKTKITTESLQNQNALRNLLSALNVMYEYNDEGYIYNGNINYITFLYPFIYGASVYESNPIIWIDNFDGLYESKNEYNHISSNVNYNSIYSWINYYSNSISKLTSSDSALTVLNHLNSELELTEVSPSDYTSYNNENHDSTRISQEYINSYLNLLIDEPNYTHYKFIPTYSAMYGYVDSNGNSFADKDIVLNDEIYNQLFPSNIISLSRFYDISINNITITNSNINIDSNGLITKDENDKFITTTNGSIISFKLIRDIELYNGGYLVQGSEWELRETINDPNNFLNSTSVYNPITMTSSNTVISTVNPPDNKTLNNYLTSKGMNETEETEVSISGNSDLLNDTFYQLLFYMNENQQPFTLDEYGNIKCNLSEILPVYVGQTVYKNIDYSKNIINYDSSSSLYIPNLVSYDSKNMIYKNNSSSYSIDDYIRKNQTINNVFMKHRKNTIGLWDRIGMLNHKVVNQIVMYKFVKDSNYTDEIFNGNVILNSNVCNLTNAVKLKKGYEIRNNALFVFHNLLFNGLIPRISNVSLTIPSTIKFKVQTTDNIENIINTDEKNDFNSGLYEVETEKLTGNQTFIKFSNLANITIPSGKKIYLYITDFEQPYALTNGQFKLTINYV